MIRVDYLVELNFKKDRLDVVYQIMEKRRTRGGLIQDCNKKGSNVGTQNVRNEQGNGTRRRRTLYIVGYKLSLYKK